ncbi:5-formyltetrahydrofolate cyclo-ligase [Tenacibaculum holothuriorum]|uniref:5-formyltetrahydrofolate cyclo-ligase n=1 Tax=Tenacibaculum holothuriorum TaxID=1635173 RepID=A0A1Y2PC96_9FLAO|nr:5-formyltetrahydrofolate cyclo-ligase [Tenacibaculum holothuriorum]OSY88104.1 5-formyltetrahydrofolate cyclo-ligase [Tenacibaculum holothuriorum]
MEKKELRKIYKQKRNELSQNEVDKLQKSIEYQVKQLDFSGIQNIHIFLPIKKQKEIDTYSIIDFLQSKNKTIIISKSDFSNNTLTHFVFENKSQLAINSYGIPEPTYGTVIDVKKIDLVFVPLLISDKKNFRVGYGKGFYDRFLAECIPTVKTIGLNFFEPIEKISNVNEFDIPLDSVIYPK